MSNERLKEAVQEAFSLAPSNVAYLETLEISHPLESDPLYIVNDRVDHTMTLETSEEVLFKAMPFRVALPSSGADGLQDLNISFDNINREVSDFVLKVKESATAISLKYRPYLSNDFTTPQLDPPLLLELKDVEISVFEVKATASFADIINKRFPREIYTRARFPSLGEQ